MEIEYPPGYFEPPARSWEERLFERLDDDHALMGSVLRDFCDIDYLLEDVAALISIAGSLNAQGERAVGLLDSLRERYDDAQKAYIEDARREAAEARIQLPDDD